MGKGIRKKIGEQEFVLVWVPAEDTTLGDAHYIDTTDYEIPTLAEITRKVAKEQSRRTSPK
jgi:hypothetical protein